MAKFGNLLVHRYGEIENKKVLEIVKQNLQDVKEFEKEIEENILKTYSRASVLIVAFL